MIIAVTWQKGGVGKSTTAICLAMAAMQDGARVLLVDGDPQGTVRTWSEVASEHGHCVPTVVAMGANMHRAGQIPTLSASYNLVLIDCPPRVGDVQRSALMVADIALLPCGPSAADAWAISASIEAVQEAQTMRENLQARILITRKQGRTAVARGARVVLESSGIAVLRTELGYRVAFQEAVALGQGVTSYAPRDPSAWEIRALLTELRELGYGEEADRNLAAQAAVGGCA